MKRTALDRRQLEWRFDRGSSASLVAHGTVYRAGRLTAIVSRDGGLWHLSVSHPARYPSWDELASARDALTPPHITLAMIFPTADKYVNIHETCLHLWEQR